MIDNPTGRSRDMRTRHSPLDLVRTMYVLPGDGPCLSPESPLTAGYIHLLLISRANKGEGQRVRPLEASSHSVKYKMNWLPSSIGERRL